MNLINELEQCLNIDYTASTLDDIQLPALEEHNILLKIKRDDRLHPIISGNKWRKLKYQLVDALHNDSQHLISMGGAYSNHLHALAYIGYTLNLKTTAFIRGEYDANNPTLSDLKQWNMQCIFVSRETYKSFRHLTANDALQHQYPRSYWINEGGFSPKAMLGVQEILSEIFVPFETFAVSTGTAMTFTSLVLNLEQHQTGLGFSSFKNTNSIQPYLLEQLKSKTGQHRFVYDYGFGGFGRFNQELRQFQNYFYQQTQIELDKVYTVKLLYGLLDLISKNYFKPETTIIALHTGGLQGNRSSQTTN